MELSDLRRVVDVWAQQIEELGEARADINYVQVFENKGSVMGSSNPHPHGQIWANHTVPLEPPRRMCDGAAYYDRHGRTLLLDYLAQELEEGVRIVIQNRHWVVLVPYWAVWPLEVLLLPRRHVLALPDLTSNKQATRWPIF